MPMAPTAFAVFLLVVLGMQASVLGEEGIDCGKLPVEMCAFAVSSSGIRCVLEKKYSPFDAKIEYECQSSGVIAEELREWIESEECLQACGLERMNVGMSSDGLAEYSPFTRKLCSEKCQNSCPNIGDLFLNLAAGEGMHLPHVCEAHKKRASRALYEEAAAGPMEASMAASAPTASLALEATPPMAS